MRDGKCFMGASEELDFLFQPSIKRERIESLAELGFLERKETAVLLGPPEVGKTHLAIGLAIAVAQSGRRVHFGTLADFLNGAWLLATALLLLNVLRDV